MQNEYDHARGYLLTKGTRHYHTADRGHSWETFDTPIKPGTYDATTFDFHAEEKEWLLFVGQTDCNSIRCQKDAYYTKNHGRQWNKMLSNVKNCTWGRDKDFKNIQRTAVFCDIVSADSPEKVDLVRSDDFFATTQTLFKDILESTISENFYVVAMYDESDRKKLALRTSIDGSHFQPITFPPNVDVSNLGSTVLESSSGSIFLNVFAHWKVDREWGNLYISDSKGASYTTSLLYTNCDKTGYVDFEKMLGVDGIYLANQVANPKDVMANDKKALRTMITLDDGASWTKLNAPALNPDNQPYPCAGEKECSLHLHLYTDRAKTKNELSDAGAVGIMVGVGNVGASLGSFEKGDMFVTQDAGMTWRQVRQGPHYFEFGDHGGVIVMADALNPITYISYVGIVCLSSGIFHRSLDTRSTMEKRSPSTPSQTIRNTTRRTG